MSAKAPNAPIAAAKNGVRLRPLQVLRRATGHADGGAYVLCLGALALSA